MGENRQEEEKKKEYPDWDALVRYWLGEEEDEDNSEVSPVRPSSDPKDTK